MPRNRPPFKNIIWKTNVIFFAAIFCNSYVVVEHFLKPDGKVYAPFTLTFVAFLVMPLLYVYGIMILRKMRFVEISKDGIRYAKKETVKWQDMNKVSFGYERNQPYLIIDTLNRRPLHVPLYVEDSQRFYAKLEKLTPTGHPIRELLGDIKAAVNKA